MGVPARWDPPAEVRTQLRLAHRLRNRLVELTRQREADTAAVWSSYPEVAAAEAERDTAQARLDELYDRVAAEKAADRSRVLRPATQEQVRAARSAVRVARAAPREAIAGAADQARDKLAAAADDERRARKALYREFCQDPEPSERLYWATFNAVVAHHKTAVGRVEARRRAGRPAQLRFHRFDGSGTIAVQLQRQAGMPPRTPELLADPAGRYRNVLHIATDDTTSRHGTVTLAVGGGRTVAVPVALHRPLPPGAEVTGAQLTVRRIAGQVRCGVAVTCRVPAPVTRDTGPRVTLHLGWRHDTDTGGLRVGTWRATEPVTVPEHLRDVVTADTDRSGTVVLPAAWRVAMDRVDATRSNRDRHLDTTRAWLADWLAKHPIDRGDERGVLTAAAVARWRSPARFAALATEWRDAPPNLPGGASTADLLEAWRRADRRRWEAEAHGRDKHHGRRDDALPAGRRLARPHRGPGGRRRHRPRRPGPPPRTRAQRRAAGARPSGRPGRLPAGPRRPRRAARRDSGRRHPRRRARHRGARRLPVPHPPRLRAHQPRRRAIRRQRPRGLRRLAAPPTTRTDRPPYSCSTPRAPKPTPPGPAPLATPNKHHEHGLHSGPDPHMIVHS